MICVSFIVEDVLTAAENVRKYFVIADIVEMRIDRLDPSEYGALKEIVEGKPVIMTLRSGSQGGYFDGSNDEWVARMRAVDNLGAQFLDVESDKEFSAANDKCTVICSCHDLSDAPPEPETIASRIKNTTECIIKIVTHAKSVLDSLRMLSYVRREVSAGKKIIGLCDGEYGAITRILGPLAGNAMTFACADKSMQTASWQPTVGELNDIYHYRRLNSDTMIFGLVGDPVEQSPGYIWHNAMIESMGLNAVYVKMCVHSHELREFRAMIAEFNIRGLSVTMPLKECIEEVLDDVNDDVQCLGACNTIVVSGSRWMGYNTDSVGAIDAVELRCPVRGKKIVIIGAGGVARAVSYEAVRRGAHVVVLNRTEERARSLSRSISVDYGPLERMTTEYERGYDVLINCTSVGMDPDDDKSLIDPELLIPESIVMDVVYKPTPLLMYAKEKNCKTITGMEMYYNQALAQWKIWASDQ